MDTLTQIALITEIVFFVLAIATTILLLVTIIRFRKMLKSLNTATTVISVLLSLGTSIGEVFNTIKSKFSHHTSTNTPEQL